MLSEADYSEIVSDTINREIDRLQTVKHRGGQRVFDLILSDGSRLFVKYAEGERDMDMLRAEVHGMKMLASSETIHVPSVSQVEVSGHHAMLFTMDFIETHPAGAEHWNSFAEKLADMHRSTSKQFGLNRDNYIGQMPQSNQKYDHWPEFYAKERLLPEMKWARDRGLHDRKDSDMLHDLCGKLSEICPEEPPSLTHGDMWSGNIMPSSKDRVFLIDPAVSYAHREMDIAMSKLFGGIPSTFYSSYHRHFPLVGDWQGRMDVYQLYYLLVHVNMFGRSYVGQVRSILKAYA